MRQITRRQLAAAAAVTLAAVTAAAQAPAVSNTAADSKPDFDKAARESHKENSATLAAFEIPISVEPAFQFKA